METKQENVIATDYADVMQKSYIDYAMSVIISRALPDVRDGLKPVQRRTLYDMYELGIRYDRPYRKCARIVGDTMGKYHPHGDSSIYEALVVMAQDFKKGKILVDGHGNFGSIEGDGAAAMRYTEARLAKITQEAYLADLDKDIIDFVPNFDETEKEPAVLPVRIPNLLLNGAEGIAVGMATSIPTHNLGEIVDAVKAYMKNNDITTKQLMKYIKGPDFPTGGIVVNKDDLAEIYETGTGKIKIRGKVDVEEIKGGRKKIVISEIPYTMIGAGIGKFLNDVCNLVETKKTSDIVDISNQSSKEGIRIVIEVKRDADVDNLINMLYKKTRLEDTFGVNMLAVADGRPEVLGLKRIIEHHVDFQFELATRKYKTLLKKEQDKKEIQEGLIKACDVIDLIIEILRGSSSIRDAKECLTIGATEKIKFKSKRSEKMASMLRFTDRQAQAILEMRLYKLIGLEIEALMKEHETTLANIVTRFFDPQKGRVLIGNTDIRDIPKETLMNKVSFVFQNSRLIKASILENVRMAKPDATREEIAHALEAAQCLDIIEKLPNGIDTVVGTKGVYLSGGEQQRIAIARAILKNAPILILDEATAFADPDNEVRVQQALSALSKGKTVIMIAHRLSSITDADCIYVLQDGEIVESGTHSGLIERNGIFTKMWKNYSFNFSVTNGKGSCRMIKEMEGEKLCLLLQDLEILHFSMKEPDTM